MNSQSHRLVFNPSRGCLMAVAETSRSCSKSSASGATRSTRTKRTRCPRSAKVQALNRPVAPVSIARAATNLIADNGGGTLRVEGKNTTVLYEVQNVSQSSVTTHTKTSENAFFDPLGIGLSNQEKTESDQRASSVAIGTRLTSTQKIEVGVGNKTELRGTEVEAPQIAFVKTDPNKTGELILGGSTNTTQSSHTEKTEYAGLYRCGRRPCTHAV